MRANFRFLLVSAVALFAVIATSHEAGAETPTPTPTSKSKTRPRLRLKIPPGAPRRMTSLRFPNGRVGILSDGPIQDSRYYPDSSSSVSFLGDAAKSCSAILDNAQEFPLRGMSLSEYITEKIYNDLFKSESYLDPRQVSFFNVHAILTKEQYELLKSKILPSQITVSPFIQRGNANLIAVTVATLDLVNGFIETFDKGLIRASMPWTVDPAFTHAVSQVLGFELVADFEFGRALQVTSSDIDSAVNAALMTAVHQVLVHRQDITKARVFFHSMKKENTDAYIKRFPSLKIVAIDPKDPENVVLMSNLTELLSSDVPWGFSGLIHSIKEAAPNVMDIRNSWDLLHLHTAAYRQDFDYFAKDGTRSSYPIIIRNNTDSFSHLIGNFLDKKNVNSQIQKDAIANILNTQSSKNEIGISHTNFVDPIAADSIFLKFKINGPSISITNLDESQSLIEPAYETRVLFGAAFMYNYFLTSERLPNIGNIFGNTVYTIATTKPEIMSKLEMLKPSKKEVTRWRQDWQIKGTKSIALSYIETSVAVYYFSMADLNRLAKEHPRLYEDLQVNHSLKLDFWFRQSLGATATGL